MRHYERKTSSFGKPYFLLKGGNNQIIGTSEMYPSEAAMDTMIKSVKSSATGAVVEEVG